MASAEPLYCVDCYVPNQEVLDRKCLERCDGRGPVHDSDGIERMRGLRDRLHPEGTQCLKCDRGLISYPSAWWKNELKMLRCNWCGTVYRVHGDVIAVPLRTMEDLE